MAFRLLYLVFVILSSVLPAAAAVLVAETEQATSLSGSLENLVDPNGALALADILSGPEAQRFEPLPGFVNRGYLTGASWTRFTYTTPAGGSAVWYLRLVPAILDDVRVYVQVGQNPASPASYREYQLGDHFPLAGRQLRHLDMLAPLPATVAPRNVYIRVRTTSTHNLQAWLYSPDNLIAWSGTYALLNGLMLGIYLVVVVVNAFYAVVARSALFAWYSLFVLCHFVRHMGLDGALLALWPTGTHHFNDWLVGGGVALGLCAYSLFAVALFDARQGRPWLHRYLQANILIGALTFVSIAFGWYGRLAPIMVISFLVLSCVAPVLALGACRRDEPGSMLVMFGFVVVLFPAIPRLLSVLGTVPSTWVSTNAYLFGVIAQAVVMTMALIQRLHISQQQLLAVTRQAEARATEMVEDRTRELSIKSLKLEQALVEKQEALEHESRFLDMISHEYRTPLAIIQTSIDIMELQEQQQGREPSPALPRIQHAVERLEDIIESTRSREQMALRTGRHPRERFAITSLISEVRAAAIDFWERSVLCPDDPSPCEVEANRSLLRTVLLNLLDNAMKYSPPEQPVTLRVETVADQVELRVINHTALPLPMDIESLFLKFHRGANSTGTNGSGLGLHLARGMVMQQGGSLTLMADAAGDVVALMKLPLAPCNT